MGRETDDKPAERLRAENERLRDERAHLRKLFDTIPSWVYVLDEDHRVLMVNRAGAEQYGTTVEDAIGRTIEELLPGGGVSEQAVRELDEAIANDEPIRITTTMRNGAGEELTLRFDDVPFTDPVTGKRCVLGIATDLTDRVRYENERRAKDRIDRDLEIARTIQRGLLPQSSPSIEGFDVAGWSEAADQTGGDYYDWLPLSDGRLVVSLADVTGHGIGPALVTAVCRAYARATIDGRAPLVETVTRLNRLLCDDLPADRFVTYVVAVLDGEHGSVEVLSGGHGPLLFYEAATGEVRATPAQGIPLGLIHETDFEQPIDQRFAPDDMLVLVSDGCYEITNPGGEQFGVGRLINAIRAHAKQDAASLIAAVRDEIERFAYGRPPADDMTMLVIKRTEADA